MDDFTSNSVSESSLEPNIFWRKNKTGSLSNINSLFVGFSPKSSELDSVRSPTSPLDFWVFTNLANSFVRSPKSPRMRWGNSKVGLSILGSLDDMNAEQSLASKNICIKTPKIKPSNLQMGSSDIVFGIGENLFEAECFENFRSCSLDSGKSRLTNFSIDSSFENFGSKTRMSRLGTNPTQEVLKEDQLLGDSSVDQPSPNPNFVSPTLDFIGSLSSSHIALSEDYTCVKKFGPNPKITHIFGDCVLECHNNNVNNLPYIEEQKIQLEEPIPYPSSYFLSLCYSCEKKLEGKDIYMYRGEKAFCSPDCRSLEISMEEKEEKKPLASSKSSSKPNKPIFYIG